MATKKWEDDKNYIQIDGKYYPVTIIELKRKADILDKTAHRSEDGNLHREVIGTFYNYSLKLGVIVETKAKKESSDPSIRDMPMEDYQYMIYNQLFEKLSEPVASHKVSFPHDYDSNGNKVVYDAYFSSVQDDIVMITEDGYRAKGLSCNCTGIRPRRRAK